MASVATNIDDVIKSLTALEKEQLPYAMMLTTNNLAFDAMEFARKEIEYRFGNKSLGKAIRVKKGNMARPYAEIYVDDYVPWRENALVTMERGGDRQRKGFERAMIRDGHLKRGEIITPDDSDVKPWVYTQMMSQLQLNNIAGYTANESTSSFRKNKTKANKNKKQTRFMLVTSNKMAYTGTGGKVFRKKTGLAPGIYATGLLGNGKFKDIVRILRIASRPTYKKQWDLEDIIQKVYDRRGAKHFNDAMQYALSKSKSVNKMSGAKL